MKNFINFHEIRRTLQDIHGYDKIPQVNIYPEKFILVVDHLSFPEIMQFNYNNKNKKTLLEEINLEIATQTLIGSNHHESS